MVDDLATLPRARAAVEALLADGEHVQRVDALGEQAHLLDPRLQRPPAPGV